MVRGLEWGGKKIFNAPLLFAFAFTASLIGAFAEVGNLSWLILIHYVNNSKEKQIYKTFVRELRNNLLHQKRS